MGQEATSILAERLNRDPSHYELWRALDLAYQSNGAIAERRQHLRRWIAAEASASGVPSLRPYLELGQLLAGQGEDEAVIELLESAPPPWDQDESILEQLMGALIRTGQVAEARALGAKILADSPRGTARPRHLLLARAAIAFGDTPTALQHYRAVLRGRGRPVSQEMAEEYLGLLLQQMEYKGQAFVRAAEETCRAPRSGFRSPATQECLGDRLVQFGRPVAALPFYEKALRQAPDKASVRSKMALAPEPSEP